MFGFTKKMFIGLLSICTIGNFSQPIVSNLNRLIKCVSLNNHPCQARSTLANINPDQTSFYSFTVSVNKIGSSCNTFNDLYAQVCVLNKVKNMNVKVFNLILG